MKRQIDVIELKPGVGEQNAGQTEERHPAGRRPYSAPRVIDEVAIDDLLEILGPAQANYGGMGMPSDRALKADVEAIDEGAVLDQLAALPIAHWRYKTEAGETRHLGPMAQDFRAAFGLGDTDRVIYTVDAAGVSLAAAKALRSRLQAAELRVAAIEDENAALRQRLELLETWAQGAGRDG